MKVSRIGEFGLIDEINKAIKINDKSVILGIGDDAAVIKIPNPKSQIPARNKYILLTTDTLVENVHFSLKYYSFFEIGWKLMAVNLSDIAAMGGKPSYAMVTLGLKKDSDVKDITELYRGMNAVGRKYGVSIVGGDIVSSPKALIFTLALYGTAGKVVTRGGARVGDQVAVIGKVGMSALGLQELKSKGRRGKNVKAHLMPQPMMREGMNAAKYATSMIDNSDGLARCLIEICKSSGVGAKIDIARIPLAKGATLHQGLDGGEDYNLVLTAPKDRIGKIKGAKVIGEIIREKDIVMIGGNGRAKLLQDKGFEHF